MPVIRIDNDVYRELQLRVDQDKVFKDNPNQVLRRVLRLEPADTQGTGNSVFDLLVIAFTKTGAKRHALAEIKRRFKTFGWLPPK